MCATDIISYLKNIDERCSIHIEECPIYKCLHGELNKFNIDNGICHDAELWQKHRWREKLPQMKYVSYWEYIRPPRAEEIEQYDLDLYNKQIVSKYGL